MLLEYLCVWDALLSTQKQQLCDGEAWRGDFSGTSMCAWTDT